IFPPAQQQSVHDPDQQEHEHAGEYHVAEKVAAAAGAHEANRSAERERSPIGVSAAGANVQNAPEGSPAMNEQFFGQGPRGSHHGRNLSGPPNSVTSIGRGRPQLSLRMVLARRPGPSANVSSIRSAWRGGISVVLCGRTILPSNATAAGAAISAISHAAKLRTRTQPRPATAQPVAGS